MKPDNKSAIYAARGGHEMVLNLLFANADGNGKLEKDPDPSRGDTPMLEAIGRGHIGVIRLLLEQDNFNPTRRNREGKTYYEIAEERRGPKWQAEKELLKARYDEYVPSKKSNKKKIIGRRPSPRPSLSSPTTLGSKEKLQRSASSPVRKKHAHLDVPKPRRLVSGKDFNRDGKRKRRVVEDEEEDASFGSDSSSAVSAPRVLSNGAHSPRTTKAPKPRVRSTGSDTVSTKVPLKPSKTEPAPSVDRDEFHDTVSEASQPVSTITEPATGNDADGDDMPPTQQQLDDLKKRQHERREAKRKAAEEQRLKAEREAAEQQRLQEERRKQIEAARRQAELEEEQRRKNAKRPSAEKPRE